MIYIITQLAIYTPLIYHLYIANWVSNSGAFFDSIVYHLPTVILFAVSVLKRCQDVVHVKWLPPQKIAHPFALCRILCLPSISQLGFIDFEIF